MSTDTSGEWSVMSGEWRAAHIVRATAVVCVLALAALAGCGKPGGGAGGPGGSGGNGPMVMHVVAAAAETRPLEETLPVIGTLEANESVELRSELDGRLTEIAFEEGRPVRAGVVLARLDTAKLEASLAEAQATLQLAEADRARYETLGQSQAVSRQEVDRAIAAHEAALASIELLRAQLADATVTAPFDGVMGERLVSPGQFVNKGDRLASLVDDDPMKAAVRVPERYVSHLKPGQPISLIVAAYPSETFTGTVYFIDPQMDEATRTVLVKATVPNPDGRLRRGMLANATLVLRVREQALVVPETALIHQGQAVSLFVVDDQQTAQPRAVTTGARLAGVVEITSGLSAGETVVLEGAQKLFPGATVQVRAPDEPA